MPLGILKGCGDKNAAVDFDFFEHVHTLSTRPCAHFPSDIARPGILVLDKKKAPMPGPFGI